MAAIPILYGTKSKGAELVRSAPLNLEPVVFDSGISKGQLKSPYGARQIATGPGVDRGGISWNGSCYRVMGTKFVQLSFDNSLTEIGDVGGEGPVSLDYGFNQLAIRSGTNLYYYDGATLTQVTDDDLGHVHDMIWIDGYFMTTDGTSVIVTELADPFSVHPLKYGSAEEDPDMVTGLIKVQNEAYILGRYTVQVFQNVGGNGFPFKTVQGATIPFGCVSASAKCLFASSFAFVGSSRNQPLAVYLGGSGTAQAISNREVVDALAAVEDPDAIILEARTYNDEDRLLVHLPNETWCFVSKVSQAAGEVVWYRLKSGRDEPYRIRNMVLNDGQMIVGDSESAALGILAEDTQHFGVTPEWEFSAGLIYNESRGGIIHDVELVGLPARGSADEDATIFMSLTRDGEVYGQERALQPVKVGARYRRMIWRPHTRFWNMIGLKFRGYDAQLAGFSGLQANIEGLSV